MVFTLTKSDETSLPARDTVVKLMKRNKYVVYDTPSVLHQEVVPESNGNIDCNIDKDIKNGAEGVVYDVNDKDSAILTYDEQKILIAKLKNQIMEQQNIIRKLTTTRGISMQTKEDGPIGSP